MTDTDKPVMQVQGVFPISARISHELMAHEATLRDYFAALAMQSLMRNPKVIEAGIGVIAICAYGQADEMLKVREKQR